MMRIKLLLAIAVALTAIVTSNQTAGAEAIDLEQLGITPKTTQKDEPKEEPKKEAEPPKPVPVEYVVVSGDTLKAVGDAHTTTWERLFYKNLNITDPNVIKPGDRLIIPRSDEVLAPRPLPTPVATGPPPTPAVAPRGIVPGNTYTPGQCTWYVKNRRPDLPNNLGNAADWLARARAQGMATGSTPRVGAVGWTSGHVVYVESVNPDGTVSISDMNGRWIPYEIGHYTYPASKYVYIY